MSTPYSKVHEMFLSKITSYDILNFLEIEREELLKPYLISACNRFKRVCKVNLADKDNTLNQFNTDLDDEVIDILATGEVYFWLNPKVLNEENFKNALSLKDYSQHSPANLLKELQSLRDSVCKEFKDLIKQYSYDNGDITKVKVEV